MQTNRPQKLAPLLLLLVLPLIGCSNEPARKPPDAKPLIRPLPSEGRQGKRPPECIPTCSDGLEKLLDGMLI